MSEAQRSDREERGWSEAQGPAEDQKDVISELSLAGLAWTATGTISPASTTLRQTASSLQTSWSVTLFILGVLSFSFSLSVFQLSLDVFRYHGVGVGLLRTAQSLSLLQCFSPHDAPAMFKFYQWDRSQKPGLGQRITKLGKKKLLNPTQCLAAELSKVFRPYLIFLSIIRTSRPWGSLVDIRYIEEKTKHVFKKKTKNICFVLILLPVRQCWSPSVPQCDQTLGWSGASPSPSGGWRWWWGEEG